MENANSMKTGITTPDGFLQSMRFRGHAFAKAGKSFGNPRVDMTGRIKTMKTLKVRKRHISAEPL
ncbi:MAG: hypothetical protein DMD72_00380 [Gemmatimonadetes bacterium]|nr:MAG: hypothetical protein DMD72_00380 [Gemmatimonadota bacterium]